jgi:hypothetical protein
MKLAVIPGKLTGRVTLADREHFLFTTNNRTMEVHVIEFYTSTSLHGVGSKWITFHGTRIRKDGTGGESMHKKFYGQTEAIKALPSELFSALEEQFLVFDKLEAHVAETLAEYAP